MRKREKTIIPGSTIQVYIPKDVDPAVLEWMNLEENYPLNTTIINLIAEKIRGTDIEASIGTPNQFQSIIENILDEKMKVMMGEIIKAIGNKDNNSDYSSTQKAKDAIERKKKVFNNLNL